MTREDKGLKGNDVKEHKGSDSVKCRTLQWRIVQGI